MTTDARMVEQAIRIARERVAKDGEEWWTIAPEYLARLADAAQAHLDTLPKVRMTATWHVECIDSGEPAINVYRSYHEAKTVAASLKAQGFECVHVTGPHMHCVPVT